ncbi:MAG: voltage-gated sodium channel [Maricaulis sp.]|jgi:voltage-gated sodium channel|nr:voltage-gated sodium channel [Maricaulis sp.]HAQ35586.1 voltage-gated sodium channel [Alphaproteobacteria bacterium]|tara:strand:+ start:216 stop:1088 length:873 start_codon:yes stop_codon:yes gene_type:complete
MQEESQSGWRGRLVTFVERPAFLNFITALILFNAVTLGLETYPLEAEWFDRALPVIDMVIVSIFVAELFLKMVAYGPRFFKSGWNWFDVIVVGVSLFPDAGAFTVLRALRILRVFRLFSVMPEMRKVVEALMRAIPGMGAIIMVLGLMFYVSAVMATKLFGISNPDLFGSLGGSAFTLFQVMTLEGWAMEVARPVMAEVSFAWIFFLVFIVLTSFAILNLFIAVIVDSLQAKHFDEEEERENRQEVEARADRDALRAELAAIRADISALRSEVGQGMRDASAAKARDKDE